MIRIVAISALTLAISSGSALTQDISAGETSFRKCQPCHDAGENARNKLGPPLNGLDGRKAGTVADYSYNEGIKNSGITWNEETFREYIKDPRAKIPDTKMFFVGIKDDKELGDLWAYLKQFTENGTKK
jgi:cytochrome c